jgi:type II secretory pathway component GspD/PulD (secretin)
MYYTFAGFGAGTGLLLLLIFAILQWLHVPAGSFIDWVIAIAIFEWLLLIVTVPWNIHFEAKEVLAQGAESTKKNIAVDSEQLKYVTVLASRSLWVAIALHLVSAIALYSLSATGISAVGYLSSGAALLLTILRPAIRGYQYLAQRLTTIRSEFFHPREDILELRNRFAELESTVKNLADQLNSDDGTSWAAIQERQQRATRIELTNLAASLENLRSTNQAEHTKLARDAESAIAQLTDDGQFLNHVREIIRFFKES